MKIMYLAALGASLAWALSPIIIKSANVSFDITWSIISIFTGVIAFFYILLNKKKILLTKTKIVSLLLAALIGPIIGYILYMYAIMDNTNETITGVVALAFISPVFVAIIEHFQGKSIEIQEIVGLILVVSGVFLFSFKI